MSPKRWFLVLVVVLPLVLAKLGCSKDKEDDPTGDKQTTSKAAKASGPEDPESGEPATKAAKAKKSRKSKKPGKKDQAKAKAGDKQTASKAAKDEGEAGAAKPTKPTKGDGSRAPSPESPESPDGPSEPSKGPARVAKADRPAPAHDEPARSAREDEGAAQIEYLVRDEKPLDLSKLVSIEALKALLKEPGLTREEPLAGSLPGREYNGVRYFTAKNETLGVTVQLWRFVTTIEARRRFDVFSARFPNAEETDAVGSQGFFGHSADVLHLGYLEQAKKSIVVISCSEDLCSPKDLYLVAKSVAKKL
jgi:hypothetical protein